jgi:nucleoside-diphosphate-sugar epimerase
MIDSFQDVRVCVTGGAGFIGSHLVDALVASGAIVSVLDDLSTGREENLAAVRHRARLIEGSLLDAHARRQALERVDIVFHLAAYVSAPGSVREPMACHRVNTEGTLALLESCQERGVRRIVFASSAAVYGDSEVSPKRESEPILPCSVYAQSKAAGEHLLRVWNRVHGLEAVSLRFFNVFGPRQLADSAYAAAIAAFASALLEGRPITIFGDGSQTRDFVPVANVVQCLMRAAARSGQADARAFNVGMGRATAIREIAAIMAGIVGRPFEPAWAPPRPGDVLHSCADIGEARGRLGYEPQVTVERGLRDTLAWYLERLSTSPGSSRSMP